MELVEQVKTHLDSIKSINGVENVVLTQRDGNPITSSGVWLSRNEIFHVSAATSAIYNVGLSLHGVWLKYMVIEGPKAKILIAPLHDGAYAIQQSAGSSMEWAEYFIALTTLSNVNLGSVFIKTQTTLNNINDLILKSKCDFKPPLREFNEKQIEYILNKFNSKQENDELNSIASFDTSLGFDTFQKCEEILWSFNKCVPDLIYSCVSFKGGYIVNSIQPRSGFNLTPDAETAMSFSLYDTASRYAWLLKKMNTSSIFLDCNHYFHFILGFDAGIFSSFVYRNEQKIGFIRLLLPKYLDLIQKVLDEKARPQQPSELVPGKAFSPLLIR
nr:roadblock/LC7 domain-containing protein [Candidatus Sigynarchaeota archaeon]